MSRFSTILGTWLLSMVVCTGQENPPADTFVDPSPHQTGFVTVNGVRLHYLDWGGSGRPLVFLHGLGNSAHIFDDLAPAFVDTFRVRALTWRGHGRSDSPTTGYDVDTLTEDLRQFLDAMKIDTAILAGHSMAGEELTRFAGLHPTRVEALVYLDAAFDRTIPEFTSFFADSRRKAPAVYALLEPSPADRASIEARRAFSRRTRGGWSNAIEADWRETSDLFRPPGQQRLNDGQRTQMIIRGYRSPDYARVKAPTLAFFTGLTLESAFPWITPDVDRTVRKQAQDLLELDMIPRQRPQIEKLRSGVPHARVIEMPNTRHDCFIHRQDDVVREMRAFLAGR